MIGWISANIDSRGKIIRFPTKQTKQSPNRYVFYFMFALNLIDFFSCYVWKKRFLN